MAKTWAEVVGSEGFQALSDAEKTTAREQYFDQVVAPQVPKDDLDLAREQFFGSTSLAPPKAPALAAADWRCVREMSACLRAASTCWSITACWYGDIYADIALGLVAI